MGHPAKSILLWAPKHSPTHWLPEASALQQARACTGSLEGLGWSGGLSRGCLSPALPPSPPLPLEGQLLTRQSLLWDRLESAWKCWVKVGPRLGDCHAPGSSLYLRPLLSTIRGLAKPMEKLFEGLGIWRPLQLLGSPSPWLNPDGSNVGGVLDKADIKLQKTKRAQGWE